MGIGKSRRLQAVQGVQAVEFQNRGRACMSQIQISKRPFSEVDIDDPFFDSLRTDYKGFNGWFRRKTHELAYVGYDSQNNVRAFVYLLIFQIFTKQYLAKLLHCMAWNYQAAKQKTFGSTGDCGQWNFLKAV